MVSSFGQLQDAVQFSVPIQVDSSQVFVFGSLIGKDTKAKYSFNDGYNYQNLPDAWTNVFFYNSKIHITTKLFDSSFVLIAPKPYFKTVPNVLMPKSNQGLSYMLSKYVLLVVRTDTYNKDGIIDENDPISLFVCSKSGNNLKQITPSDLNVNCFSVSADQKKILLTGQKDLNGDRRFKNEDEGLYEINIEDDYSEITLIPFKM